MSDRPFDATGREHRSVLGLLAAGYAACAVVSILFFQFDNGVAGVWLPNVFAVAVMLRHGSLRRLPAIAAVLLGCLAANFLLGAGILLSMLYCAANLATVGAATTLIGRMGGGREMAVTDARGYSIMLGLGGIAAPAIAAVFFAALSASILGWPLAQTFWHWISGEALGFALMFPILMMASRKAFVELFEWRKLARLAAVIGASVLFSAISLKWMQFPFLLVIVPLMAAVVLLAPFELAIACGSVGVTLVGLVIAGALPGLDPSNGGFAYSLLLSVAILAVLPFIFGLIIEQMRRDRRRIAESEQRFRRAMQDSAIGVAIVGLDGHFVEANAALAEMLGYSREELEKLTFFRITHPDDMAVSDENMQRIRAGQIDSFHFEKRYLHKDGKPVWVRLAGSVIRDPETRAPLHLISQFEDIGARKHAEKAIADAETRWSFALASAGQGLWDVDMRKGRVTYSSTWKQMLGYGENELDGDPDHWLTLIHPDDRERVEEADRAHTAGRTQLFEAEFRMRHKQGHWIWILDRGQVIERDENGEMVRAIGTLTDITMRREAEDRLLSYSAMLADEKERLRVTLDSIGDAVICTDAAMRITFMNPVAEKLTGVAEKKALGKPLEHAYAPVDEETGERIATAAAIAGLKQRAEHNSRAILSKKDGSRCAIREVVSPIHTEKGEFSGSVIVFQDFTDARALQRRLAHAAAHDSLTGLPNRASLLAAMSGLVSASRQDEQGDLFLYVDLDNFKTVNDTGGHAAGDLLLKQAADVIRAAMRPGDFAARLGGDEFAVILRNCPLQVGEATAAQLVAAIGRLGFERDGLACTIGASIGLTAINRGEVNIDEIVSRADLACYNAKAGGRGRVTIFEASDAAASQSATTLAKAS